MEEYLTNPIFLGVIAGVCIFVILSYLEKRKMKDNESIKYDSIIKKSIISGLGAGILSYIVKSYGLEPEVIPDEIMRVVEQQGGAFEMTPSTEFSSVLSNKNVEEILNNTSELLGGGTSELLGGAKEMLSEVLTSSIKSLSELDTKPIDF
jgi:hypothetical protein